MATLITLLSFAFVLGVLVFVHELGHFLAAKRVGIKVLKFQLGFNPTIAKVKRGDTEYSIGALPLGGYVKMAGDNPEEGLTGSPDEFLSKSKWERFQVLIMGPVMNLGLAVILTAVVLYNNAERPAYEVKPVVVGVVLSGSGAAQAGMQSGDHIVAVSDKPTPTWEDFFLAIGTKAHREVTIRFNRGGEEFTRNVTPLPRPDVGRFEIGDIGVLPDVHPHIGRVLPGRPGQAAGLLDKDVVVTIDGEPMTFREDLVKAISKSPEKPISLAILRGGQPLTITATPGSDGKLGIEIGDEMVVAKLGLIAAVRTSVEKNIQMAGMIFETIGGLFTQQTSPKQLMGPVAIAQLSGETAQLGWVALLAFMAQLSLNLGLLNLLPIPILDGGHIFIMGLEGLARRDFSIRLKEKMLLAGFVVLMLLMVTVIYNDLTRISWIERLMPWR